ncbi:MAG: M14 family metallopeptidase [Gemmatimonadales bacterium]
MGRLTLVFGVLLALGATHGRAQEIPSPADVLGYGPGARFTDTQGVFRYARHLSEASPRVQLVRYGETPEGRPLILLVLAREDRMDVLDQIRARIDELRDPGLSDFRAAEIARETPAVAWLAYGVHGDEASSTEAALWTAYDIAGAASEAAGILDSLVVLIDPMLNPDGRDRYVQWYRGAKTDPPNRYADAYEHAPPWPGGRYNHYLFDLNRDWAWAVQPETRARLAQYARWNPQVLVDVHEMSYTSSYFFFPPAEPVNPVYPPSTSEWGEYFGQANAHEFDRRRWLYYTEQTFDLFYPGYGDSWSSLTGAIGMTYEQAGSRRAGLAVRRPDGTVLTLADRLAHHRIAGLATLRAAAARKTELLENYAAFHRDDGGEGDFLLVPADNPEAVDDLVALLLNQGIVVERGSRSFGATASPYFGYAERTEFPAGTYRVPRRQPRSRLARTLLQAETPFDGTGVEYTYDITAWSLPYAFGVEAHTATGLDASVFEPVTSGLLSEVAVGPLQPVYGYLVPPGFAAAGPLHSYAAVGGRAYALEEGFEAEGRRWPPGTVFLPSDDSTEARMRTAGLTRMATPATSGRSTSGLDLGSDRSLPLEASRIAVLMGDGISPTSYGQVWYLLERGLAIPFDPLPTDRLTARQLARYDVVVAPPARSSVYEQSRDLLAEWVKSGGTLVAMGEAARWTAGAIADLAVRQEDTTSVSDAERLRRALRTREERRSERWEDAVTGVILPARADPEHPLAWGTAAGTPDGPYFVLHRTDLSFEPDDRSEAVIHFPLDVSEVSGVIGERKLDKVAGSSWLATRAIGEGRVVLFADDPLFRLFWRSAFVPFTNSLLYGPSLR